MKIFDSIEKIILYICSFLLLVTLAVTGWQVFSRYVFGTVFVWAEELSRYCSIAVTLLGASIAVRHSDHISVDLLSDLVKNSKVKKIILFGIQEIAVITFYILITVSTVKIWPSTMQQMTPGLKISMVVPYIPLIVGSVLAILFNFEKLWNFIKKPN